ncbi:MAG: gamma-glutamylcyclotransferase [Zetaproteobacteria bacterium]|nr:MAG: gamma-glutamylcyclotransferase [Zetaproteobacteria bacterium]
MRVFVYGTLKRGQAAARLMEAMATFVGEGVLAVPGVLLQWAYPAFVRWSQLSAPVRARAQAARAVGYLVGEVWQLRDLRALARLDAYEDAPRLYRRVRLPVRTERGVIRCWVYEAARWDARASFVRPDRWGRIRW